MVKKTYSDLMSVRVALTISAGPHAVAMRSYTASGESGTLVRVLLVDDHAILRRGLAILLNAQGDISVVGEASNGRQAIDETARSRPDVVIMDLAMADLNGFEATRLIRAQFPTVKVVILSAYGDASSLGEALSAGASAFLIKRSDIEELSLALKLVASGNSYFSRDLTEQFDVGEIAHAARSRVPSNSDLTPREREILQLIAEGRTMKAIAVLLTISPKTVEGHSGRIMAKTGAKNRADLVRYAIGAGLVRFDDLPARNSGTRSDLSESSLKGAQSGATEGSRNGRRRAS